MSKKSRARNPLRHIISFRVSDQELQILKRLGGRTTRMSGVLRQIVKHLCESSSAAAHSQLLVRQSASRG